MGTGGTKVTNKQTVATTNLANNAVTSAKISAATIATADLANNAVTGAKISAATVANADLANAYATYTVPFFYSGAASGAAKTLRMIHYFSQPATVVGLWFAMSGTAAAPTAKAKVDCHVVKAIASGAASTNSIFRTGAKASNAGTVMAPSFKAASGTVSGAAGALMWVTVDAWGSAATSTKLWGGVVLKQALRA